MAVYDLPTKADIGGKTYNLRTDYRAALDMIEIMNDSEISDDERGLLCLQILYPEFDEMPQTDYQEAIDYLYWFIGGGDEAPKTNGKKLMDWQQDFSLIVSPVNRVLGYEVRAVEYLHWWSFLAAYYEIGECLYSQVVGIRSKKAKGIKLDKQDQEFYRRNRHLVDIKSRYTEADEETLSEWLV